MKTTKNNSAGSGARKRKAILIGLGIAALGAVTYFGLQYLKRRRNSEIEEAILVEPNMPKLPAPTKPKAVTPKDSFPLKKGSKGENVKALQQALIAKYGKDILPKYGADGDFGSELETALKKAGLPTQVDQSTFNVLKGSSSNALDARQTASQINSAITAKNFAAVIQALKAMRSVNDYKAVNEQFLSYRVNGVVRQTLVTALLNAFTQTSQKDQLRAEFLRMGLKYDGSKWALSGIDTPAIITTEPTVVWKDKKIKIQVPANMVLGSEVSRKMGFVLFENSGRNFLVAASAVTSYKP